ncbi:MAG: hypothetical protein NTU44_19305 [Bacteroidetes bacterium]|nr:hypothetical protein [Bacteroidota bacterium]
MKRFALVLTLISFVCFVGLTSTHAQEPKKATTTTKVEQKAPAAPTTAVPATATPAVEKSDKCPGHVEKKCDKPCDKKGKAGCCKDKKDQKGCTHEKELK